MPVDRNDLDGINDMNKDALLRAKNADLITLPKDINGTNCSNCNWISKYKKTYGAMCNHPKVKQYVNSRMCCALWSNKKMYAPFERDKEFE
jgi:hypothetical protein